MKRAVVIVAGGKGVRMGTSLPKQFMEICGKPILFHTIHKFMQYDPLMQIYLVLPAEMFEFWSQHIGMSFSNDQLKLVKGGSERFHSVKNAIDIIPDDVDLIGVHDGVRPLVGIKTIATAYTEATLKGNAIPCIAPPESIRVTDKDTNSNHAIDRSTVKLVQTPQVFSAKILKEAYNLPYTPRFTDDASVVEQYGEKINLIEGDRYNIKITTIEDLKYAEYILSNQ